MASHDHLPPRLTQAIRRFALARASSRPVSVAGVMRRTRRAMPGLKATDDELADLIAAELISAGCNVDFDGRSLDPGSPVGR